MKWILLYLLVVNVTAFSMMADDKRRAQRHAWRIPERILFLSAAIGGSAGAWAGMYIFHHKTRHLQFVVGIPFILTVQIAAVIWVYRVALHG